MWPRGGDERGTDSPDYLIEGKSMNDTSQSETAGLALHYRRDRHSPWEFVADVEDEREADGIKRSMTAGEFVLVLRGTENVVQYLRGQRKAERRGTA
jgi:hypothetical protein